VSAGDTVVYETFNILMDIECLFDVRLASLQAVCRDTAARLINEGIWDSRQTEVLSVYEWVSDEIAIAYDERRKKHLPDDLIGSTVTRLANKIIEEAVASSSSDRIRPIRNKMSISINIYPYKMSKEVVDELYSVIKESVWPFLEALNFVSYEPKDLSPSILFNYTHWYTFNYGQWSQVFMEEEFAPRTDFEFILPFVFQTLPDDPVERKMLLENMDVVLESAKIQGLLKYTLVHCDIAQFNADLEMLMDQLNELNKEQNKEQK